MLHGRGHTLLSARRGRTLYQLAADVEAQGIAGDIVDCGVYNGGSTTLLAAGAPGRRVWAFDSFEGLPEPGHADGLAAREHVGDCHGSEAMVRDAMRRFSPHSALRVVPGWFQDTFPRVRDELPCIAILHADGDWYDSVRLTLESFADSVSSGGYIIIDDYGHWEGARRATDEFRTERQITAPLVRIDYTACFWRVP